MEVVVFDVPRGGELRLHDKEDKIEYGGLRKRIYGESYEYKGTLLMSWVTNVF